jgi:hypothetical protein
MAQLYILQIGMWGLYSASSNAHLLVLPNRLHLEYGSSCGCGNREVDGVHYIPLVLPEALLHFCALPPVSMGFSLLISAPRVFPFNFEESRLKDVISLQNEEMLEQWWLATWVRSVH